MAYPKEERNRRFLEDWKVYNLDNEKLGQKYRLTIGGVKALKQRLREKERSSRGGSPATDQNVASTSTSTSTNPHRETKRMTFWLPEGMIAKIKARAEGQRETASQFLRALLDKYLK